MAARSPSENQTSWDFYIEGVRCSKCIQKLESLNLEHDEIEEARFNKTHNLLTLKSHHLLSPKSMIEWIEAKGYHAYFVENPTEVQEHLRHNQKSWLIRLAVTFFFASNLMMFSLSLYFGADGELKPLFSWLCGILYLPILLYSAIPLYQNAWQALKTKQFSADLAIVIAFLWGSLLSYINLFRGYSEFYFDSTASFIFLILLARFFLYKVQTKIESE
jgi:Cu2+-exporting ATPase/Cu+-exporting ATPase